MEKFKIIIMLLIININVNGQQIKDKDSLGDLWIISVDKSHITLFLSGYKKSPHLKVAESVLKRLKKDSTFFSEMDYSKDRFLFWNSGIDENNNGIYGGLETLPPFENSFIHKATFNKLPEKNNLLYEFNSLEGFNSYLYGHIAAYNYKYWKSFVPLIRVIALAKSIDTLKSNNINLAQFNNIFIMTITDGVDRNDRWLLEYTWLRKYAPKKYKEVNNTINKYNFNPLDLHTKRSGRFTEIFYDEEMPHIIIYQYETFDEMSDTISNSNLFNIEPINKYEFKINLKDSIFNNNKIDIISLNNFELNGKQYTKQSKFLTNNEGLFTGEIERNDTLNSIEINGFIQFTYNDKLLGNRFKKVYFNDTYSFYSAQYHLNNEKLNKIIFITLIIILISSAIWFFIINPNIISYEIIDNLNNRFVIKRGLFRKKKDYNILHYNLNDNQPIVLVSKYITSNIDKNTPYNDNFKIYIISKKKLINDDIKGTMIKTLDDNKDYNNIIENSHDNYIIGLKKYNKRKKYILTLTNEFKNSSIKFYNGKISLSINIEKHKNEWPKTENLQLCHNYLNITSYDRLNKKYAICTNIINTSFHWNVFEINYNRLGNHLHSFYFEHKCYLEYFIKDIIKDILLTNLSSEDKINFDSKIEELLTDPYYLKQISDFIKEPLLNIHTGSSNNETTKSWNMYFDKSDYNSIKITEEFFYDLHGYLTSNQAKEMIASRFKIYCNEKVNELLDELDKKQTVIFFRNNPSNNEYYKHLFQFNTPPIENEFFYDKITNDNPYYNISYEQNIYQRFLYLNENKFPKHEADRICLYSPFKDGKSIKNRNIIALTKEITKGKYILYDCFSPITNSEGDKSFYSKIAPNDRPYYDISSLRQELLIIEKDSNKTHLSFIGPKIEI